MTRILATGDDLTLTFQRVVLGVVIGAHGAQKLLGWFGGYGFAGTMGFFTGTLGLPAPVAFLVIVAESLGALGLVVGLLTRVGALGVTLVMLGAIFMAHLPHGFFMNWFGNQGGEGYEFHLLALALAIPLLVRGGGRGALDGLVLAWLRGRSAAGAGPAARARAT